MSLPNIWHLFNLQANPFFQDIPQPLDPPTYPMALFVAREHALNRLLAGIGGSTSSRQVIAGWPGVGKTTLSQRAKADAAEEGYVTNPAVVGLLSGDTTDTLLVRILANVYEAALATLGPALDESGVMAEVRHIVQAFRQTNRGVGIGLAGASASYSQGQTFVAPVVFDALSTVRKLLQGIEHLACYEQGRTGIIVHLNNLENLVSGKEYDRAATLLRDIRDLFLLHNYHWLVVGSTEALEGTLLVHPQVASIFPTPEPLEPLTEADFLVLLERRCDYLTLNRGAPIREPVTSDAATTVYRMFHGDLRGALRALQEGAENLLGYGYADPVAPIEADALVGILGPRYRRVFEERRSGTPRVIGQFDRLATFETREFTQGELQKLWGVSAGRVSQVIGPLIADGYITLAARFGRENRYRLTGAGQLVLQPRLASRAL